MNQKQEEMKILMELQGIDPNEKTDDYPIEEVKNDKAFISNDIINALFENSTITAFKIMFYLSRVNSTVERGDQLKITLNLKDLLEYTRLRKETLDDNIAKLQKTLVTFYNKDNKQYFARVQLIGRAEYSDDNKGLIVWLDKDIYSRLKETQKAHTEFNAPDIMRLSKYKHSIRILMLLTYINGFTTERQKSYNLNQLNYMFDTEYSNYSEFCRKVLDKARDELSNNGLMTFDYTRAIDKEYFGKGRKPIKHITIVPIVPEYTEPNIYAYIEQSKQKETPKVSYDEIRKILAEEVDMIVHQKGNNEDIKMYYYERLDEFIQFCIENNKEYKNWNISFKRHMNGYEKNLSKNDKRI